MNGPIVLLADEPTGNLDPDLTSEIIELFKSINARGTTVIVATHDPNVLAQVNRRVITLDHGKLVSNEQVSADETPPVSPAGGPGQCIDEPDHDGGGGGDNCLHLCMRRGLFTALCQSAGDGIVSGAGYPGHGLSSGRRDRPGKTRDRATVESRSGGCGTDLCLERAGAGGFSSAVSGRITSITRAWTKSIAGVVRRDIGGGVPFVRCDATLGRSCAADHGGGQVQYNQAWVEALASMVRYIELAAIIVGVILSAASVTIIANTIRLALYSRREEIEILGMIGASTTFIRVPYLLEGAALGLLGSALSLVILKAGFELFRHEIRSASRFLGVDALLTFFPWEMCLVLVLVGLFLGCAGSFLSLLRFGEGRA